jgi:hypothetical protein
MAQRQKHATDESARERQSGARRLIAGLRITPEEEVLLAVVRPFLPGADSAGEVAYRLWRRGLEVTLAEAVSVGAALPAGSSEQLVAGLVAQRLLLCMPLLRRTGMLVLLGVEARSDALPSLPPTSAADSDAVIDSGAATAITSLGGSDFL